MLSTTTLPLSRTFLTRSCNRSHVVTLSRLFSLNAAPDDEKNKKEKVVILGTGWGGFNLANTLENKDNRELYVVSPSNHFVSHFKQSIVFPLVSNLMLIAIFKYERFLHPYCLVLLLEL